MQHRYMMYWIISFALLFTAISMVQKLILDIPLFDIRFFFPPIVGLIIGAVIGILFQKIQDKKRFLENIINAIRAPLLVIRVEDYTIAMANQITRGKRPLTDLACHQLSHHRDTPCTGPEHICPITEIKRTGEPITVEHLHYNSEGEPQIMEVYAYPVFDQKGKLTHIIEYSIDITERKEAEQKLLEHQKRLDYLAHRDSLTGLPNRNLFLDRLGQAIARAHRKQRWVALLFMDLDGFKDINDTLGHAVGDSLLMMMAIRMGGVLFEGDTISRLGGDEFTIIIEGMDNQHEAIRTATHVARKLLDAIAEPIELAGSELVKTGSIGIALYPQDGTSADILIKNADAAMYHTKSNGGNSHHFFSEEMSINTMQRMTLECALRKSLIKGEMSVYYQPQIDLATGKVVALEALLRWQNSELGTISPERFIPIAEESGLILPVGQWVLEQACLMSNKLRAANLPPLRVAVNLSLKQFLRPNLAEVVYQILSETKLAPELLEVEITESTMIRNSEQVLSTLILLRRLGVRIACDDFGVGYSSLSYISKLPLDTIKIDRSFIRNIGSGAENADAIVNAIIMLANSVELDIVAEGIETESQADYLSRQGCHIGQGFFYSQPLPVEELILWLKQYHAEKRRINAMRIENRVRRHPT